MQNLAKNKASEGNESLTFQVIYFMYLFHVFHLVAEVAVIAIGER